MWAVAGCQGGGSPGRPWLRGTDASSTVFGAGAQDPGIETVYGAKLAAAQYPCDLRPKAFSWSPKWASQLQPKSWPLSVEPGMFLPRPVSLPTTSSPALGRPFPVSTELWSHLCSNSFCDSLSSRSPVIHLRLEVRAWLVETEG